VMFSRAIGAIAASCYFNKKYIVNDFEFNKSLSFSNLCSTDIFHASLGMHRCFAENNTSRNALHEKSINLKSVSCNFFADDQGFDDKGFDKWLTHEGSKFDFKYDWRPASSYNVKKMLIFVAAPHANNYGTLSALGTIQNDCLAERVYSIVKDYYSVYNSASLIVSKSEITSDMVAKRGDVFKNLLVSPTIDEANPGKFEPRRPSDIGNDNQCVGGQDRQFLEDSFRKWVASGNNGIKLFLTHPNLIRYMVLKTLQFPMNGWKRFQVSPGSITIVGIMRSGDVVVEQIGAHFFHKNQNNEYIRNVYEN